MHQLLPPKRAVQFNLSLHATTTTVLSLQAFFNLAALACDALSALPREQRGNLYRERLGNASKNSCGNGSRTPLCSILRGVPGAFTPSHCHQAAADLLSVAGMSTTDTSRSPFCRGGRTETPRFPERTDASPRRNSRDAFPKIGFPAMGLRDKSPPPPGARLGRTAARRRPSAVACNWPSGPLNLRFAPASARPLSAPTCTPTARRAPIAAASRAKRWLEQASAETPLGATCSAGARQHLHSFQGP